MKLTGKKTAVCTALVLSVSLSACGNKGKDDTSYLQYEHVYGNVVETVEIADSEGFYPIDDYVYITSNDAVILSSADDAATTTMSTAYAMELHRNGYNENYSRFVTDEGNRYINNSFITTIALANEDEFDYSITALDIVDTDGYFYTYDDCLKDMSDVRDAFPEAVTLNVCGLTDDNRDIYEIVIGDPKAEKSILIVAGMEGPEYMTAEYAVKAAEYYAHYYSDGIYKGYHYSDILKNCCIRIVPMINPDGVTISQLGLDGVDSQAVVTNINSCFERDKSKGGINSTIESYLMFYYANAAGVDLRYNFPFNFESAGVSAEPSNQGYKGEAESSEAETQSLINMTNRKIPDAVVVLRTTGCTVNYGYGTDGDINETSLGLATSASNESSYALTEVSPENGSPESYFSSIGIPSLRINIGSGEAPLSTSEFNSIWNSMREVPISLSLSVMGG